MRYSMGQSLATYLIYFKRCPRALLFSVFGIQLLYSALLERVLDIHVFCLAQELEIMVSSTRSNRAPYGIMLFSQDVENEGKFEV